MPDLIASLPEKTGFIPDIYLAPPNQTYNQLILSVSQGLYDLMIADTTTTATRRSSVDFSNSIFDNSLRLVICKSFNPSIDLLSFLQPFSRNLWLLVLAACFYAGALIFLAERGNNEALRDRPFVSQLLMSIWYAFDNMFGYGVDFDVHTAAGRLVTAGLYILSMILVASYTANLASDLTISKTQNIISGLDDLKNGNIPPRRVGIAAGTAGEDFYLREVSGDVRNYVSLRDEQAMFDYLLSGTIDVALFDGGVAEYMTNTIHCSLTLVDEEYDKGAFGIKNISDGKHLTYLRANRLTSTDEQIDEQTKRNDDRINDLNFSNIGPYVFQQEFEDLKLKHYYCVGSNPCPSVATNVLLVCSIESLDYTLLHEAGEKNRNIAKNWFNRMAILTDTAWQYDEKWTFNHFLKDNIITQIAD
ncbi:hypothetical protein I4U23_016003 [Adineta vaga]|nr:hypothetical protein I4U23_016003 [Adineta vaga]